MNVNEVFCNMMNDSNGKINLTIDGFTCSGDIQGDAGAMFIGIRSIITALAKQTGKTEEEILTVLVNFFDCSKTLTAESNEQLKVMVELINRM